MSEIIKRGKLRTGEAWTMFRMKDAVGDTFHFVSRDAPDGTARDTERGAVRSQRMAMRNFREDHRAMLDVNETAKRVVDAATDKGSF